MYPNLTDVSDDAIKKAQEILGAAPTEMIRKDLTQASAFGAYNLQPIAVLLQPVICPWRNLIPRVKNTGGGDAANWKYISSLINAGVTDPTVASEGARGNRLNYSATPASAPFVELAIGDTVTWAAQDGSQGQETNLKARAVTHTLMGLMMLEEIIFGFSRIEALPAVTAPTIVGAAAGGAIADGTYNVKVRAIIGCGDGTNKRGRLSAATSTGALAGGGDNVINASTPWVEGAVGYEWYVDDGAGGAYRLQTTTGVNVVKLTALAAGAAPPADNSANAMGMKGLVASFTAALGAQVTTLATDTTAYVGTDFVLDDIDAANKAVWDNAKASPEIIWMNSTQLARATNLVLAANGAPTLFVRAESTEMAQLTGGYMLASYVNKSTGQIQKVRVHPYLPDGTMMAFSQSIPFPTGGDTTGIDVQYTRDYQQVDFALSARKDEFEVFCREALRVKFPGGAWVIRNIKSNRLGA